MTYLRREEIFSKEYITTHELQELLGYKHQQDASKKLCEIKRAVGDRLGVQGKLHVEDYLEFFNIKTDRYSKIIEK